MFLMHPLGKVDKPNCFAFYSTMKLPLFETHCHSEFLNDQRNLYKIVAPTTSLEGIVCIQVADSQRNYLEHSPP
jgi:hypothetical protein